MRKPSVRIQNLRPGFDVATQIQIYERADAAQSRARSKERSVLCSQEVMNKRSGRTKKKVADPLQREMFILFGKDGQPGKLAVLSHALRFETCPES